MLTTFGALAITIIVAIVAIVNLVLHMRPRRFYFVRHGETLLNAQHIKQGVDGSLSEKGQQQAENVGRDLENLGIKQIISSTYPRAKETSEIINKHLKVLIIYSPLLCERRNPKEVLGKHTDDPEVAKIIDQIDLAYHADDFRFSDEENFVDLKKRARKCLSFLSNQNSRGVCVVTHHKFLKMLLSYMLYRGRLHADDFIKLAFFNTSDNAGVTICEYHPWEMFSRTRGWEVISYNQAP